MLFTYPLDFTFVCPTEMINFSNHAEQFAALNCDVLAIRCDSVYTHLAWCEQPRKQGGLGRLSFYLVSDLTRKISPDYGVLLQDKGHPLRGTFIVDDKGILRAAHLHEPSVSRSVEETLRIVAAYQYTDKHGEVCPSGWKPDGKSQTIKPIAAQARILLGNTPGW